MNGCQRTSWSEELDGKDLHGAAWWWVRSGAERVCFFLYILTGVYTTLTSICKCDIMLVLKVVVFSRDCWCCCCSSTRVPHKYFVSLSRMVLLVTRTNRAVFPRVDLLFAASARSVRVVPENSRTALVICSGRWTWGGYDQSWPHNRLSSTVLRSASLRAD